MCKAVRCRLIINFNDQSSSTVTARNVLRAKINHKTTGCAQFLQSADFLLKDRCGLVDSLIEAVHRWRPRWTKRQLDRPKTGPWRTARRVKLDWFTVQGVRDVGGCRNHPSRFIKVGKIPLKRGHFERQRTPSETIKFDLKSANRRNETKFTSKVQSSVLFSMNSHLFKYSKNKTLKQPPTGSDLKVFKFLKNEISIFLGNVLAAAFLWFHHVNQWIRFVGQ